MSIALHNNRDLNQDILHLWSKFGDPSLNGLWCGQAQIGVNLDFQVKFHLESQDRSLHKTIGILTKVFYTCDPSLVILTWMGDELSRGQARAYRTHGHTHKQMQATIPGGQNWTGVKSRDELCSLISFQITKHQDI